MEKLWARVDAEIEVDAETPYDPHDPAAVDASWTHALVIPGGGVDATRAGADG